MTDIVFTNFALLDVDAGELRGGRDVLISGNMIKAVREGRIDAPGARVVDLGGRTLMPGLIDCHVHICADGMTAYPSIFPAMLAAKAAKILRETLMRGFTTIRDAGGADMGYRQAIEAGLFVGPRLFVAGRPISQTGGHVDSRNQADFCVACACTQESTMRSIADGVDHVRRAVREELRRGADQIKIMASGGVASPTDPIAALGYSEDEIRAIVAEARARQTYVMAHSYTAEAIARAVRLGVRTIEHGNLIDDEAARVMREHGAYAVPTLVTYEALASEGAQFGLPPESVAKIGSVKDAGLGSLEIFKRNGVPMGFGTDLLGPSQRLQSEEFRIRTRVLSNQEVIQSATTIAAEVLQQVGKLGRLQPGAIADVLAIDGNPLRDIGCLTGQGERIPLVIKGGAIQFNDL
jgi:imidazolonepropionase-like amidohydrolase